MSACWPLSFLCAYFTEVSNSCLDVALFQFLAAERRGETSISRVSHLVHSSPAAVLGEHNDILLSCSLLVTSLQVSVLASSDCQRSLHTTSA